MKHSSHKETLELQNCCSVCQCELTGCLVFGTSYPLCGDIRPRHSIK